MKTTKPILEKELTTYFKGFNKGFQEGQKEAFIIDKTTMQINFDKVRQTVNSDIRNKLKREQRQRLSEKLEEKL